MKFRSEPLLSSASLDSNDNDKPSASFLRRQPCSVFGLLVLTAVQLVNQATRFLLVVTSAQMQRDQNWGLPNQDGSGPEYNVLFGPAFVLLLTMSSIPLSMMGDCVGRKRMLCVCIVGWSLACIGTSYTKTYTQLLALRMVLAVFQSPVQTLSSSMLADMFPLHLRGTAMSIYNVGIYLGYSVALGGGNYLVSTQNWNAAFFWGGMAGLPVLLLLLLWPEPTKGSIEDNDDDASISGNAAAKMVKSIEDEPEDEPETIEEAYAVALCSEISKKLAGRDTFSGAEGVDIILQTTNTSSREEALVIGNQLFAHDYIKSYHHRTNEFVDSQDTKFEISVAIKRSNTSMLIRSVDVIPSFLFFKNERRSLSPDDAPLGLVLEKLKQKVEVQDRKWRGKAHAACFVGREAVDVMVESNMVSSRRQALLLAQRLVEKGCIHYVVGERAFEDDYLFYRFVESASIGPTMSQQGFLTQLKQFCSDPVLVFMCLGGGIRFGAGYIWAQYSSLYYELERGQTKQQVASYMGWIPTVGGLLGAVVGGVVGDWVAVKMGPWARLLVVMASNLTAAPFAVGTLIMDVPWCYLANIPQYMCAEMWMGITICVVIEVVPMQRRTFSLSLFLFAVAFLGGNFNLLLTPVQNFANNSITDALLLLFPGMFALCSMFFMAALIILRARAKKKAAIGVVPKAESPSASAGGGAPVVVHAEQKMPRQSLETSQNSSLQSKNSLLNN